MDPDLVLGIVILAAAGLLLTGLTLHARRVIDRIAVSKKATIREYLHEKNNG